MMSGKMCPLHKVAATLVWIGGLNWLLIGINDINLVEKVLGSAPGVLRAIYVLVGVSALFMPLACKCPKCCTDKKSEACCMDESHKQ